jgi:single-stranded-DNA-specific exonuclease
MISVSGRKWLQRQIEESRVAQISNCWHTSWLVARLASYRANLEEMSDFLFPKIATQLPDPFGMLGMKEAVECFLEVLQKKQKVCIFADYDVDGATSAALLVKLLSALNVDHIVYVPDRINEGYGLSISALKKFIHQVHCIITVDCGSSSKDEIAFAKSHGVKVIVLDHHAVASIPSEAVVVNPNRLDESGKLSYLAAVGVVYLFLFAVLRSLRAGSHFPSELDLIYLLDLVALGTVCDAVPLIGLNRTFVTQGLKVMRLRKNIGIKALVDAANVKGKLSCYHLGFVLGPRINAGSRVGESSLGVQLLTSSSHTQASYIASHLEEYNLQRILIEKAMLEEAIHMAKSYSSRQKVLVLAKEGWHVGLIGIVASRIKDLYGKPVAIVSLSADFGKGSCRSIAGFNFGAKLLKAKLEGIICSGGGHYMAAGFTLERSKLHLLEEFLENEAAKDYIEPSLTSYFDEFISAESLDSKFLEALEVIAPYGSANPAPVFCLQNAKLKYASIVSDAHLCCTLEAGEKRLKAFAFGQAFTEIGMSLQASIGKSVCLMVSVKEGLDGIPDCTIKDVISL